MMVFFVSDCKKRALKRTRTVMDMFANRISAKTWYSIITNEGLSAIYAQINDVSSKNTALTAFWVRSRYRIEVLWHIGNTSRRFDDIRQVNETKKGVFMEFEENRAFLANTKSQPLDQHLFAVGYLAKSIIARYFKENNLEMLAFIAGIFHDIGKCDPVFQQWLSATVTSKKKRESFDGLEGVHIDQTKFGFEKYPRHNEVSSYIFMMMKSFGSFTFNHQSVENVILWHHEKPIRKEPFVGYIDIERAWKKSQSGYGAAHLYGDGCTVIESVFNMARNYSIEIDNLLKIEPYAEDLQLNLTERLPSYKHYSIGYDLDDYKKDVVTNAKVSLIRSAVVAADRLVSSLEANELMTHIQNQSLATLLEFNQSSSLGASIGDMLDRFNNEYPNSERNLNQKEVANKLSDNHNSSVSVLRGPAGCGKSKIALEWSRNTSVKKMFWICPRVQVCQGLFTELSSSMYLQDCKIEINTGEIKELSCLSEISQLDEIDYYKGDIVITTIDQMLNMITTHKKAASLMEFIDSHVVFDEFHEYVNMPGFNLLFAELVEIKKLQTDVRCLLISATPNPFFVNNVLELSDIICAKSYNESLYRVSVLNYEECDGHPFLQKCHSDTAVHFYISNTAKIAQLGYIFNQDEGSYCFHSKFTTLDKKKVFEDIYNDFKQNGNRSKNVLRSGPVVQASLNITCDEMHSEPCSPENMLQRVGRLDRFGENSAVNTYNIYTPNSFIEGKKSCNLARFLSRQDNYSSSFSWLAYLNNSDVDEVNIASLYQLYDQFYDKHDVKEKLANELMITLEKGVKAINRSIFDPLLVKKQPNSSKKVAKKNSLRGNSRFVQMACVDLSQLDEIVYAERYATQLSDDNTLTYAVDAIRGYDDSEKDCLAFMHKKHHKLYGGKKAFKSDLLLDRARTSDLPVYLSYIPGVLSEIHEKAFEGAIYYGFNDHQPIGAINQEQINQLKHGE